MKTVFATRKRLGIVSLHVEIYHRIAPSSLESEEMPAGSSWQTQTPSGRKQPVRLFVSRLKKEKKKKKELNDEPREIIAQQNGKCVSALCAFHILIFCVFPQLNATIKRSALSNRIKTLSNDNLPLKDETTPAQSNSCLLLLLQPDVSWSDQQLVMDNICVTVTLHLTMSQRLR